MSQSLDIETIGRRQIVRVHGDLDAAVADKVRTALESRLVQGLVVVVDCAEIGLVDSHGLSCLICAHYAAGNAGAGFELRHVPPSMRRVIQAAGIGGLFTETETAPGSHVLSVGAAAHRPAAREGHRA